MALTVEQACPQCGAPMELEESDHLLACTYCGVNSFLHSKTPYRFILPPKNGNDATRFAPYFRFRGKVYFCAGRRVGYKVLDFSHALSDLKGLPLSLGVRPQALRLRFATSDVPGIFLHPSLQLEGVMARAAGLTTAGAAGPAHHRAYVGEALNVIYLPLELSGGGVHDGITGRRLAAPAETCEALDQVSGRRSEWQPIFLGTVCPQCGWNLEGARDSVALLCANCDSLWEADQGAFKPVPFSLLPAEGDGKIVYLPFWRLSAEGRESGLNTFGDLLALTEQPRSLAEAGRAERELAFWSPAFKIRPKVFLQLCSRLTLAQPATEPAADRGERKTLHPVTLPRREAAQVMKVTVADLTMNRLRVFPRLPGLQLRATAARVAYLPFIDTGYELVRSDLRLAINKNALELGRQL